KEATHGRKPNRKGWTKRPLYETIPPRLPDRTGFPLVYIGTTGRGRLCGVGATRTGRPAICPLLGQAAPPRRPAPLPGWLPPVPSLPLPFNRLRSTLPGGRTRRLLLWASASGLFAALLLALGGFSVIKAPLSLTTRGVLNVAAVGLGGLLYAALE